ncbi:MAG TPA: acyl-CoA dehydrogenase family protein [Dehalococcoidia bacterium]|nr:acyl-CoA dehydrogenase family protein [Dehalococcoidia bacterium]
MNRGTMANGWLEKARSLAPIVEQCRDEGDRERRLPRPIFDAACAAGFQRMLLPRALGGGQADLEEALTVGEEFARQDGSTGWNLTFAMISPLFSDYLPEAAARAIFERGDAVIAGSFAPRGRARRVDGGFELSGGWSFVSGCQNANLIIVGGVVFDGEQPELGLDGAPVRQIFVFPAAEGTISDTWRTVGMRATGSHDYAVSGVFVPAERSFAYQDFFRGPAPRPGLGYPRPFMEMGPLHLAAIGLGVARDAIESFTALAATKTPLLATSRLADQPIVHDRVGRAEALLCAARSYLFATAREIVSASEDTPPMVLHCRLAAAHAAESAIEVVNAVYHAAGGTSIFESSRLSRCFRDINTLTHHALIAPNAFATAGEWLLQREERAHA